MESIYDKVDLPDRLDPMTVKELRQGLRRGMFLIPFIGIHIFAIAAMVGEFYMDDGLASEKYTGVMQLILFFDQSPFWWVAGGICMFVMPLGAVVLMSPEMEEGNYELLQMTPLSRWKIVLGKFFAMWSICLLTFSSLLPYMIVRYFVGGMDVWRNIVMALTVVTLSGVICAGALAASSFKGIFARIGIILLFFASLIVGGGVPLTASALVGGECGIFYHINVLSFVFCYTVLGLVMARSRIRLVVHHYEVKPSWMVVGLLIFTPMVSSMATLITGGWLGGLGLVAMGIVAKFADVSPKAASWKGEAKLNINIPDKSAPGFDAIGKEQAGATATAIPVATINATPVIPPSSGQEDVVGKTAQQDPFAVTNKPVEISSPPPEEPNATEETQPIVEATPVISPVIPKEPKPPVAPIKKYPKVDKDDYTGWK